MTTSFTVTESMPCEIEMVWALLTDPGRHREADGHGTVGAAVTRERLERVGQVFTMEMSYRSGEHVDRYRTDNHVTELDRPRSLAWATAAHGGDPLGWTWRYELAPDGPTSTRVSLTYDWSAAPPENVEQFGVPNLDADGLRRSLLALRAALTS